MLAIDVVLEGADAPTLESEVVIPIEHAMASLKGVHSISSRSEADHARIELELSSSADLFAVSSEAQHALGAIMSSLPAELSPPTITRSARGDEPVIRFAVHGDLPLVAISEQVHDVIKPRFERLAGVGRIEVRDIPERAVIIDIDLDRASAVDVSISDVLAAIERHDMPAGRIDANASSLRVAGEIATVDALADMVVRKVNDVPVRLRDIARIEDGLDRGVESNVNPKDRGLSASPRPQLAPREPSIAVWAQYNANRSDVVRAIRDELARLALPPGLTLTELPRQPKPTPPSLVVSLYGPDLVQLNAHADAIDAKLRAIGIVDIARDPPIAAPEQTLTVDRNRAAQLDVAMPDVHATLRALHGSQVGDLIVNGKHRPIVMHLVPSDLDRVRVATRRGQLISLADIVSQTITTTQVIARRDQVRTMTLSIRTKGSLAAARDIVKRHALPEGFRAVVSP